MGRGPNIKTMKDLQSAKKPWLQISKKKILVPLIFLFVLLLVPIFPHSPNCSERTGPTILGSIFLSRVYLKEFSEGLAFHGISYVAIDGVILLRLWDWLDTEEWVSNTSRKSVVNLVDEEKGAVAAMLPENVKDLVADSRTRYGGRIENTCELVRAVAVEGW